MADQEYLDERREYLEERKLLIDAEREAARSFDRAMITLSAGALGLSITFIHQIVPSPRVDTLLYLFAAWIAFGLALLTTSLSFLFSQEALRTQREILDSYYEEDGSGRSQNNHWARITNRLNYIAILFFAVGILLLVIFSATNLYSRGTIG